LEYLHLYLCGGGRAPGSFEVVKSPKPTCRQIASGYGHQHIVDWIDQQEDESDCDSEEQREREREREITMEEMLFPDDDGDYDSDGSYDSYSDEYF